MLIHPEEQLLQAAKQGNKQYIEEHLRNMDLKQKIRVFVHTPSIEIAHLLQQNGINPNAIDKGNAHHSVFNAEWEYPALAEACKENWTDKALWLIEQNADVNAYWLKKELVAGMSNVDNVYRLTPLMWAIKNKNLLLIQNLLAANADVTCKGHDGDVCEKDVTVYTLAEQHSYEEYTKIVELLKSAGAKE